MGRQLLFHHSQGHQCLSYFGLSWATCVQACVCTPWVSAWFPGTMNQCEQQPGEEQLPSDCLGVLASDLLRFFGAQEPRPCTLVPSTRDGAAYCRGRVANLRWTWHTGE